MATLVQYGIGLFLALHGLVHFLYVGISLEWFEVEEDMGWSGESWLLSGALPRRTILNLASALYVVVAAGFVLGGVGYVLRADWATAAIVGSAVLSTLVIVATWDGRVEKLADKGGLGVLINAFLVVWRLVLV